MNTKNIEIRRKSPIPMAIPPERLFRIIHKINKLDYIKKWDLTALASFLYLTGGRISEVLDIKRSNIETKRINENLEIFVVNIKTLKSRIYPMRIIPIAPIKTDKPFYDIFHKFLSNNEYADDDYIFPFQTRFIINKKFKKVKIKNLLQLDPINKEWIRQDFNLHPHYLRHCRLSHLASVFDYNEIDLMRFAGWASIKPCVFYVKLSYKDLLKKMIKADVVTTYAEKYLRSL